MATTKNPQKSHLSPQERKKFTPKKFLKKGKSGTNAKPLFSQTIIDSAKAATGYSTYGNFSTLMVPQVTELEMEQNKNYELRKENMFLRDIIRKLVV